MDILSANTWMKRIQAHNHVTRDSYRAMYSSWWDGVVTDPNLMMIAIDDHHVHRGDAVFEAFKAVDGKIYLLKQHLARLERSMKALHFKTPFSLDKMEEILTETLRVSELKEASIRLFVGRGPGSFSANPYDTLGAQLHVIVCDFKPVAQEKIEAGVSLGLSKIPVKEPWMAQVKSCNYLVNVLMKKEAVDQGVDFTVGVDAHGHLTEGSTENLILLDQHNHLIRPKAELILAGTTMLRAFELASDMERAEKNFSIEDLRKAKEIMMIGTTLDVLSVTQFQGQAVGGGKPGPFAKNLRKLLLADQRA